MAYWKVPGSANTERAQNSRFKNALAYLLLPAVLFSCSTNLTDQQHLQKAREYRDKNDYRSALSEYKDVLQLNPQNREARWELGNLYLYLLNGSSAEKEFRRAAELGIDAQQVQLAIARALLLQRRFSEVAALCEGEGSSLTNTNSAALALCAEAWVESGAGARARDSIRRAIEMQASADVLLSAVRVSVALNNVPAAQEWARKALEASPENPDAWLLFADLAFAGQRHVEAAGAYEKVIEIEQKSISTARSTRARVGTVFSLLSLERIDDAIPQIDALLRPNMRYFFFNYMRGLAAFMKNDFKAALDFLQRGVKDSNSDSPAFALLGAVHFAIGNFEQAELYLGKYVDAVPEDFYARNVLASARRRLHREPDQLAGESSALDIQADRQALTNLANALARAGDYREGRENFRRALSMSVGNSFFISSSERDYEAGFRGLLVEQPFATGDKSDKSREVLALIRDNREREGLELARRVVNLHSRQPDAHNGLGGVYLVRNDFANARTEFDEAISLDNKYIPALINLGILEHKTRNARAAREYLARALELSPENAEVMIRIAQIEEEDGRQASAIDWLEKARQTSRNALEPRILLARFRLRVGQAAEAEALGQECVEADPGNPLALMLLGDAQLIRQALDRAEVTFSSLIRAAPRFVVGYVRLAEVQRRRSKFEAARENLQRALALEPLNFSTIEALANLEMRIGKAATALKIVDGYLRKRPDESTALALRGDILMALKNFRVAEESYAKAARENQTRELVAKEVRARMESGRADTALALLDGWLKKNPDDIYIAQVRADVLRNLGQTKQAIDAYEQVLAKEPGNMLSLNNLALAYLATNDQRALETAQKAYAQLPGHPYVADTLGWVLVMSGEPKKGLSVLVKVAEWARENPDIQTHLAIALERNGERTRAKEIAASILVGDRRFESRALAEDLIRRLQQ